MKLILEAFGALSLCLVCLCLTVMVRQLVGPAAALCLGGCWLLLIVWGLHEMHRIDSRD